jgi:plastocyanin
MAHAQHRLALASVLFLASCNFIWQADEYTFDAVVCTVASDCPGNDDACQERACVDGRCSPIFAPAGQVPDDGQIAGDCAVASCDGLGATVLAADDTDLPIDGLECTEDVCSDGMADNPPLAQGTPCTGGAVCDGLGNCGAATCGNGVIDGDESDIDCGGSCPSCQGGMACNGPGDCTSGVCIDMICKYPNCFDGVHNGDETDVDCGGPCSPCPDGAGCNLGDDCESGVCEGGQCLGASCSDGIVNGTETDVDCGGACPDCADGLACQMGSDCQSGHCAVQLCVPASCANSMLNAGETDVDCGGPLCAPCVEGKICNTGSDCISGNCNANVCAEGTCNDGLMNGMETGIDCGGPCAPCGVGDGCQIDGDCVTTVCVMNVCAPLNGCNPATTPNYGGMASVNIAFQGTGNTYVPPCIRVDVGTTIVLNGNFSAHPTEGGKVVQGVTQYDPTSPFSPATTSGSTKSYVMTSPGMYPYYCIPHAGGGMYGAVFVE